MGGEGKRKKRGRGREKRRRKRRKKREKGREKSKLAKGDHQVLLEDDEQQSHP